MSAIHPYAATADDYPVPETTPARESIESAILAYMRDTGKPAAAASVTEICRRAFVARSTFYANYRNVDEALETIENRLVRDILDRSASMVDLKAGPESAVVSCANVFALIREREPVFRTLLLDVPDPRFVDKWKKAISHHFWRRLFAPANDEAGAVGISRDADADTDVGQIGDSGDARFARRRRGPATLNRALMLEMIASAVVAAFTFWLAHPDQVEPAEIDGLVARLIVDIDDIW
ncbi:hypothetical protein [Bifidobacterium eulemuris]|uniref:HTH tetR-type domain-containing protein n=1 Tax=Bifidobacterium eulemuris TaxID=1765219 RepID=A0A261G9Q5_9BIFI|nr:hypothetical protein [Bifidobacterium eulemuris]OZG68161.1 hypothetical protein BEUL_1174 [Bifidobacterium eulemuris]QOL31777.1 hypothetical protein BE0216_04330 [Bifidobacterium eulemuris]